MTDVRWSPSTGMHEAGDQFRESYGVAPIDQFVLSCELNELSWTYVYPSAISSKQI
jgi:hypothetical protein